MHVGFQETSFPRLRTFACEQHQSIMENANSPPASELDRIPTVWLLTGIVVFPFLIYQLLGFLSPLIHNLTAMRISEVCPTMQQPMHPY